MSLFTLVLLSGTPLRGELVSLEQAVERAERAHPSLKAAAARNSAAEGVTLTARAYPNPQFGFLTGRYHSLPAAGQLYNVPVFTLSQPLELGQLRPARLELAMRGVESSQQAFASVRLAVLSNVRRSFYQVLRRDREISIANDALRLAMELRDRIRVRVEVGEVGRLELIRADSEVATARSIAANARASHSYALAVFRAAVGEEPTSIEPAGELGQYRDLPPLERLRQELTERHPALSLSRAELRRASARLGYERALRTPQPQLLAEVDNANPSYRVGFSIDLPFWNRRAGEIATAEANVREAQYLADSRRVELLAALDSAYERFQVSNQEVAALEQGLMREAQEAVRAAESAYQLGERSILEVLDAQRVLRTVRLNLLNAQFDRQAAIVEIDELRAAGPGGRP